MPFSTKCFYILFKFKLCSVKLSRKLEIARKLELLVPSFRLVLKLDLFYGFRESLCSSSNILYGFEQARAQAQMFYMVSSKLKLKLELFVRFRASSSSSSNFLFGARNSLRQSMVQMQKQNYRQNKGQWLFRTTLDADIVIRTRLNPRNN